MEGETSVAESGGVMTNTICESCEILGNEAQLLTVENFALGAKQCIVESGLVGDDYGNQYCQVKKSLEECLERLEWHYAYSHESNLTGLPKKSDARAIRNARKALGK